MPAEATDLSLLQDVKTSSGAYPACPIQWVLRLFPGVKQPGHEGDHSPQFSAEVKNE